MDKAPVLVMLLLIVVLELLKPGEVIEPKYLAILSSRQPPM